MSVSAHFKGPEMIYDRFCTVHEKDGRLENIDFHYSGNFNFAYDVVDAIAAQQPDKTALVWCNSEDEEKIFSFRDIRDMSIKYAKVLMKNGIGKGDRVIVCLRRHYEYWPLAAALEKIGAVMIPMTHMLTAADFVYRLKASDAKGAVITPLSDTHAEFLQACSQYGCDVRKWTIGKDIEGYMNLSGDADMESAEPFERISTKAEEPMLIYFTSGTTGYPKGVIHDHTYALAHIVTAKYWQGAEDNGLHFTLAETGWAKASWGKLYGQWLAGSAVMAYDFDNFDPSSLVTIINKYHVTSFCAPPTVYRYLVRKGVASMPSLRHASTAGEYLSPEIFRAFKEKTGLELHEGYGQTETVLIAGNLSGIKAVDGSMGVPSPLYTVMITDENGKEAARGERGEIVILPENGKKPIGIFSGYLGNDGLYKDAWKDGVYHTGDSACMDEDGYLWFKGRFDDIIKSGGYRIGPAEIEDILVTHPAVLECAVIGVPDPLRGQAVKALILLEDGFLPSKELDKEIKEYCNSKLAEYKWIRKIGFVESFPKTISNKIRKNELRKAEGL